MATAVPEAPPIRRAIQNRAELLAFHEECCNKARSIMDAKNSDYGANTDVFRNFHGFGAFGILVRLSDKLARARTFLEKLTIGDKMAVAETIEDTIIDAINYCVLYLGYIRTWGAQK